MIARRIQGYWRGDGLALAGGLEALEFMEGPEHAPLNVGLVPMEFGDNIGDLHLPRDSLAQRNLIQVVLGGGQFGAENAVDGIPLREV